MIFILKPICSYFDNNAADLISVISVFLPWKFVTMQQYPKKRREPQKNISQYYAYAQPGSEINRSTKIGNNYDAPVI